jgi:Lrp/AsnC family leucine-responsive transcriptional regulator
MLETDARMSIADLARALGMSSPSVSERLRRLEEAGVIRRFSVEIDPAALGFPLGAYIRVRPLPGELQKVASLLAEIPEIVECDRITGDDCFVARAYFRSVDHLERVIDKIMPHAQTNTSIIQSSPVAHRLPPLNDAGLGRAS